VDVGIWIESMTTAANLGAAADSSQMPGLGQPLGMQRGMQRGMAPGGLPPGMQPGVSPDDALAAAATNNVITLVCRAVSLKITVDPSANNKDIAFVVRDEIAASPLVNPDPKATQLVGEISPDDANGTFTFTVSMTPLNPLKF